MQLCAPCTSVFNLLVVNVDGTPKDTIDPPAGVDDFHFLENEDPFFFYYVAEYLSLDDGIFCNLSFPHQMVHSRVQYC